MSDFLSSNMKRWSMAFVASLQGRPLWPPAAFSTVYHADIRGSALSLHLSAPACLCSRFPVVTGDNDWWATEVKSHPLKLLTVTALLQQNNMLSSSHNLTSAFFFFFLSSFPFSPPLWSPHPFPTLQLVSVSLHFPQCWSLIQAGDNYKFIISQPCATLSNPSCQIPPLCSP